MSKKRRNVVSIRLLVGAAAAATALGILVLAWALPGISPSIFADVSYRLRTALGRCTASAGPFIFLTRNATWTAACQLTPACIQSAKELIPEFTVSIIADARGSLVIRGESAVDASSGLFVASFPARHFDGAVTVHVAMRTALPSVGCAARAFLLPAIERGKSDALRVAVFSDSQSGAPVFRQLLQDAAVSSLDEGAKRRGFDLLVHVGDTTQDLHDEREAVMYFLAPIESFFTTLQQMSRRLGSDQANVARWGVPPVLLVRANHDSVWSLAYNGHVKPSRPLVPAAASSGPMSSYFVAETGPIRWIVLDAIAPAVHEQVEWLRSVCATIAATNGEAAATGGGGHTHAPTCRRSWTIAVVHIPPFIEYWEPEAWFNRSESEWGAHVRTAMLPLLAGSCGVDVLLSGHSHIYQRGALDDLYGFGRIPLIAIVGGAGGGLEDVVAGRVADWGVYSVTAARHHFAILSTPAAPTPARQHWEGDEPLEAASECRRPLSWAAIELGGRCFDRVILQSPTS